MAFRGTSADQDGRLGSGNKVAVKTPAALKTPVDVNKVNMEVIKPWITEKSMTHVMHRTSPLQFITTI